MVRIRAFGLRGLLGFYVIFVKFGDVRSCYSECIFAFLSNPRFMKRLTLLVIALFLLLISSLAEKVSLSPLSSDHMVIQRDKPVAVWW